MGTAFVDAVVATPKNQVYIYGPTVVILGTHSNVFTDFDGGDGTVAIHGYPSDPATTKGVASSHGCVRAGPKTIDAIDTIPLGSPVDVVALAVSALRRQPEDGLRTTGATGATAVQPNCSVTGHGMFMPR